MFYTLKKHNSTIYLKKKVHINDLMKFYYKTARNYHILRTINYIKGFHKKYIKKITFMHLTIYF